jgi:hypothetical protein
MSAHVLNDIRFAIVAAYAKQILAILLRLVRIVTGTEFVRNDVVNHAF